jgi:N-acyl-phosphatidylethanolamine-hydrolysing phospholipase D
MIVHDPALPPHRDARGFHNPPGSPRAGGSSGDWLRFLRDLSFGPKSAREPLLPAGHVLDESTALAQLAAWGARDTLTWLGHACFLIRLDGRAILTDPYLTAYAAPLHGIGPKRYAGTGISIERLPKLDAIVLSHNHYDHLDAVALRRLAARNDQTCFVVPLGLKPIIRRLGYDHVHELDWGDVHHHDGIAITALPAVHFSSRTPFDRNRTLWCGFGIRSSGHHLHFAGDTGWGAVFEPVGRRFGPFDTALVPIGAYAPRPLMQAVHADPEEAVRIGLALRAERLVAMHWGTIRLTTEPAFEPPQRFRAAASAAGYADDAAWVMRIGETRALG